VSWLRDALLAYRPADNAERGHVGRMLDLLENEPRCFWRDVFAPGHFTGSALVVNPSRTKVLLMKHKYIERWFQFGGHADGNENLAEVAMMEAREESGFNAEDFRMLGQGVVDVDIHPIPANPKKNEPAHEHFDVRFLVEANDATPLPVNPEGLTLAWVSLEEAARLVDGDAAMLRLFGKVKR
jgi:8-oxo-dGTP pyrophosphatase MutT (NUDIX family)